MTSTSLATSSPSVAGDFGQRKSKKTVKPQGGQVEDGSRQSMSASAIVTPTFPPAILV